MTSMSAKQVAKYWYLLGNSKAGLLFLSFSISLLLLAPSLKAWSAWPSTCKMDWWNASPKVNLKTTGPIFDRLLKVLTWWWWEALTKHTYLPAFRHKALTHKESHFLVTDQAQGRQVPAATVTAWHLIPTPSAIDGFFLGSLPGDKGLCPSWPEYHHGISTHKSSGSDVMKTAAEMPFKLHWAFLGGGGGGEWCLAWTPNHRSMIDPLRRRCLHKIFGRGNWYSESLSILPKRPWQEHLNPGHSYSKAWVMKNFTIWLEVLWALSAVGPLLYEKCTCPWPGFLLGALRGSV